MAPVILLDTHVVVWLYGRLLDRIPAAVQERLSREQLALSPFVQLELAYLREIGRLRVAPTAVVEELTPRLELTVADVSCAAVCTAALAMAWTRDPFDRLLAAHATVSDLALVTKDATLLRHCPLAWWSE